MWILSCVKGRSFALLLPNRYSFRHSSCNLYVLFFALAVLHPNLERDQGISVSLHSIYLSSKNSGIRTLHLMLIVNPGKSVTLRLGAELKFFILLLTPTYAISAREEKDSHWVSKKKLVTPMCASCCKQLSPTRVFIFRGLLGRRRSMYARLWSGTNRGRRTTT